MRNVEAARTSVPTSLSYSYNQCVPDPEYRDSVGVLSSPIWLLADSRPSRVATREPLDARHPTRHTIWTPILDHVQDCVFEACGGRLNSRYFYIRNAVEHADDKKQRSVVDQAVLKFRDIAFNSRPMMIICFGQFAFEFARRACESPSTVGEPWTERDVKGLGREFHTRIATVSPDKVTVLPLLHAIVARQFDYCHAKFSPEHTNENYFEYVGRHISNVFITYRSLPRLSPIFRRSEAT
jgi:hypothetical protein